jgi:hypothetical protein
MLRSKRSDAGHQFYQTIKLTLFYCRVEEVFIVKTGTFYNDNFRNIVVIQEERKLYFQKYFQAILRAKKHGININFFA